MELDSLTKFLGDANKATYADKTAQRVSSLRPESRDYHFEKEGLIYHDTYFGVRDYIGEEIVYENGKPEWGMNYFGFVTDAIINEKEVYDFLREALKQDYDDIIPVRGPKIYKVGNLEYRNAVNGDLKNFEGREEISKDGKKIYSAVFHGGLIK